MYFILCFFEQILVENYPLVWKKLFFTGVHVLLSPVERMKQWLFIRIFDSFHEWYMHCLCLLNKPRNVKLKKKKKSLWHGLFKGTSKIYAQIILLSVLEFIQPLYIKQVFSTIKIDIHVIYETCFCYDK